MTAPQDQEELTALEMARNLARTVDRLAGTIPPGPEGDIDAYIRGIGPRQHGAAQLAACLALVSIAEDVRRLTDYYVGPDEP